DLAVINGTASTTGTFILLVHDAGFNWTGGYDLTLTKVLGPQAPDPSGDEGAVTSGATRTGTISPWGDIDRYTVNLTAGEAYYIVARDPNGVANFGPVIELYRPNVQLFPTRRSSDVDLAVISGTASTTGTFILLVRDA